MDILKKYSPFEKTYFSGGILLLIILMIIVQANFFSMISASLAIIASALNSKMIRNCFWFYILSGLSYIVIAYQNKLYGEVLIYIIYQIPMYIRGLIFWGKSEKNKEATVLFSLKRKHYLVIALLGIIATVGYGYVLTIFGTNLAYLNSLATFCLITATFLAAKKYKQQWLFWMIYTLVLIAVWGFVAFSDIKLLPSFVVGFIYIGINIMGMRNWNNMYKNMRRDETEAAEMHG